MELPKNPSTWQNKWQTYYGTNLMADQQKSYSQLTRDVVQASPEPQSVDEIVEQVNTLRPITSKNPKNTIRTAIQASAMIVFTGEGFGWKSKIINGSIVRYTLRESDLLMEVLQYSDELQDALCPSFHAQEQYKDLNPARVELPNGSVTEFPFERLYPGVWGTHATPVFWEWIDNQNVDAGDHLLFKILNAEERRYSVTFEARRDRNGPAISERNQVFVEMIVKMLNRPYGAAPWEITTHALARGYYQHPIPPDPLHEIWRENIWNFRPQEDVAYLRPETEADPLLSELFERPAQVYNPENPPDLPPEYDPNYGRRRPMPSTKVQDGKFTSYTFRINHRALPEVWRDIELAEDQTLEDLHLMIQQAYGWNDDHLYSFFMSGKPWDKSSEVGSPWSDSRIHTHQVELNMLKLVDGQKFLYIFDYGENQKFDVVVLRINLLAKKGNYPLIVARHGKSPPQYLSIDAE